MPVSTRLSFALIALCACRPFHNPGILPRSGPVIAWTKLRTIRHDAGSFTQGLVFTGGVLYESAGGERTSRIFKVDASTGETLDERKWPLAIAGTTQTPFAEGFALEGSTLVQLSWMNERALTWSLALERGPDFKYEGEGWGLCFDGTGYWRSDGSARLHRHAAGTFAEQHAVTVTTRGEEVTNLNELECIGEHVLANVWHTAYVVVIRARDGVVVGVLDFTALADESGASGRESVLNGIAWDSARKELYVTGKHWPKLFVVRVAL